MKVTNAIMICTTLNNNNAQALWYVHYNLAISIMQTACYQQHHSIQIINVWHQLHFVQQQLLNQRGQALTGFYAKNR